MKNIFFYDPFFTITFVLLYCIQILLQNQIDGNTNYLMETYGIMSI